jgi:hypothetical protein
MTPESPESPALTLPADLVAFLAAGRTLADPGARDAARTLSLRALDALTVEPLDVEPSGWDYFTEGPTEPAAEPGPVPAIRLASLAPNDYGPVRLLVWLPEVRRYGVWDSADHCLQAFRPGLTWEQIAAAPGRYLNLGPLGELRGQPSFPRRADPIADRPGRDPDSIKPLRQLQRSRVRVGVFIVAVTLAAAAVGYLHLTSPPPAISAETFDRITLGMSEREVDRMVHARPGFYAGYRGYFYALWYEHPVLAKSTVGGPGARTAEWGSRDGLLTVYFDDAGRVCGKRLVRLPDLEPSRPAEWSWWRRLGRREWPDPAPTELIFF